MKTVHHQNSARTTGAILVLISLYVASGGEAMSHAASPTKLNAPLVAGGDVELGRFSPDGSRVMYYADQNADGIFEVFSVPSSGGTPVRLNGPLVAGGGVLFDGLQFSPDGSRVFYRADQTTVGLYELFSVPSAGGVSQKLNGPLVPGRGIPRYHVSSDSSRVLYRADQTTDEVFEVFSVASSGGTPQKLNVPLSASRDVIAEGFSPDSSRVLYVADQTTDNAFELFSVPSSGGTAIKLNTPLVAGGGVREALQFSPDGSRVLYVADQDTNGLDELFIVPITGGPVQKLNGPLVAGGGDVWPFNLQFSADSSRVVYHVEDFVAGVRDIYSVPSTGGTAVKLNGDGGSLDQSSVQLSADSSRVLYRATMQGVSEVFSVPIAGGMAEKLNPPLVAGGGVDLVQFSPDGSRVVYTADQNIDNVTELFSVPSAGGAAIRLNGPLVAGGDVWQVFKFSPDGTQVLYRADQTTDGVAELFIVPTSGGTALKVSGPLVAGGNVEAGDVDDFQFSPDGSRILYLADQVTDGVTEVFTRVVRARWQSAGGSWDTAANWDQAVTPDEVMQVFIDKPTVVTVTGGTTQRVVNQLQLGGGSGASVLELRSNAVVSATNGAALLPGGVLRGDGVFDVGDTAITNPAGAEIRVGADERLHLASASFTNAGRVESIGTAAALAEIEFSSAVMNESSSGTITARNSILRFGGGLTNAGSLAMSFGTTDALGDINNTAQGRIVVSGESQATFYDDVLNNGTIQVSAGSMAVYFGTVTGSGNFPGGGTNFFEGDLRPGNSPAEVHFGGDLLLGPSSHTLLELAGAQVGSGYDQLDVAGSLSLGGTLEVALLDGFNPGYGESFDLLDFGSLAGRFDAITLPTLDRGLAWDTSALYSTGTITAVPEPAAWLLALVGFTAATTLREHQRRFAKRGTLSSVLRSAARPAIQGDR